MTGHIGTAIAAFCLLVLSSLSTAAATSHADEIAVFAGIMADARTAAERCSGVTINEERLAAEKQRLHIEEVDYFAFRKEARDQADALVARLRSTGARQDWCEEMIRLYGSHGAAIPNVLGRR